MMFTRRIFSFFVAFCLLITVGCVTPAVVSAQDITVSYTQLIKPSLSDQGIRYYDTTPTRLDTPSNQNADYLPLEVWKREAQASLNMKGTEWIRLEVAVAEAGYYSVGLNYGTTKEATLELRTGNHRLEVTVPRGGSSAYAWTTANDLGNIYLEAGNNDVYLENTGTVVVNFRELLFSSADDLKSVYGDLQYIIGNGKVSIIKCDTSVTGELIIPDTIEGYPVTLIGYGAFSDCVDLEAITIPGSVTDINDFAFSGCHRLTNVHFDGAETDWNALYIGADNLPLTDATVSFSYFSGGSCGADSTWRLDYNGVLTIGGMGKVLSNPWVNYCDKIQSVVIESGITSLCENAFTYCDNLTDIVVLADNLNYVAADGILFDKTKTTLLHYPAKKDNTSFTVPATVTVIENGAFANCENLTDIFVAEDNPDYSSDNGVLFDKTKSKLLQYPAGKSAPSYSIPEGVTGIHTLAFYGCVNLTSVTIPATVTFIGQGAFLACNHLTEVYFNGYSTQFSNISIGADNTPLTNATVRYPSAVLEGSCGNNLTWRLSGDGILKISGTGEVTDGLWPADLVQRVVIEEGVTAIGSYAFDNCGSLTDVTIGNSVTTIGEGAFYNCERLTEITIPNSVTTIGDSAFRYCSGLTEITIPDGVTTIGVSAFYNCYSLTGVTIGNRVTTIGEGAFYNCGRLTEITIPDSVTTIADGAFSDCGRLTEITIPDSVTTVGEYVFYNCDNLERAAVGNGIRSLGFGMFYECDNLKKVVLSDGLTMIGNSMFSTCKLLTEIVIPNSVTTIGGSAFYGCNSLTEIVIPDSVTTIGNSAFSNCESLTEITIPDSVTTIGASAFYNCSSLFEFNIPDSVTSIGAYAFFNTACYPESCWMDHPIVIDGFLIGVPDYSEIFFVSEDIRYIATGVFNNVPYLTDIYVEEDHPCYSSVDGVLFDKTKTVLLRYPGGKSNTTYTIPDGVTTIAEGAFYNCGNLTEIVIPDSVTTIENSAFSNCESLTEITIPDSVTVIGAYAFSGCDKLSNVITGNGVTTIGDRAFYGCGSLTNVTIGNRVTTIGNFAFYDCGSLTNVTIGNSVATIGGAAFYNCGRLTEITIPDSVTTIGNSAFNNCSSLTEITIPDSVTTVGEFVFYNCDNLERVTVGNGIRSFGPGMFYDCDNLKKVVLSDGLTMLGNSMFRGCFGLTEITIPDSVTTIGNLAFYNCISLTDVYYEGSEEEWTDIAIESRNNEALLNATIHYNCGPAANAQTVVIDGVEKIRVTVANIPAGSQLMLACYQGEKLVGFEPATVVDGQTEYDFLPAKSYTSAKILVFENFDNLCPVIKPVFVP